MVGKYYLRSQFHPPITNAPKGKIFLQLKKKFHIFLNGLAFYTDLLMKFALGRRLQRCKRQRRHPLRRSGVNHLATVSKSWTISQMMNY